MGGGELTREFLRDDLVDELHLGVVPVLIGEGIPAFPSGFSGTKIHASREQHLLEGADRASLRAEKRPEK